MRGKKFFSVICVLMMLMTSLIGQTAPSTDVANSEVGDVRIINGHEIIEVDSGQTLAEVFETLRQQDFETACAFDQQGNKLLDVTSNLAQQVYTSSKQRKAFAEQGGVLFLHNHPSDGSFSAQDLRAEATYETPRSMVVSDHYIYTLEPRADGWGDPQEMYDFWWQRYNYHLQQAHEFAADYKLSRKTLLASEEPPDDGSFGWFHEHALREILTENPEIKTVSVPITTWLSHQVMLDVAEEFQMEYHRYEVSEFDFEDPRIFQLPNSGCAFDGAPFLTLMIDLVLSFSFGEVEEAWFRR